MCSWTPEVTQLSCFQSRGRVDGGDRSGRDLSRAIEPNYHYEDETEPRFQAIGATRKGAVILLVVFVDRTRTNEETETIVLRLISARKANAYETQLYVDARET
jgi:uncharacterized DUF497 family protein